MGELLGDADVRAGALKSTPEVAKGRSGLCARMGVIRGGPQSGRKKEYAETGDFTGAE